MPQLLLARFACFASNEISSLEVKGLFASNSVQKSQSFPKLNLNDKTTVSLMSLMSLVSLSSAQGFDGHPLLQELQLQDREGANCELQRIDIRDGHRGPPTEFRDFGNEMKREIEPAHLAHLGRRTSSPRSRAWAVSKVSS